MSVNIGSRSHLAKLRSMIGTVFFLIAIVGFASLCAVAQPKAASPSDASASASPAVRDVSASLSDLTHVISETNKDLAAVSSESKKGSWMTFWRKDSPSHYQSDLKSSIQRNLEAAVPGLITDAQNSHGSLSATFKLYNNLIVVCESLDSLVGSGNRGRKDEYSALENDLGDMSRIKRELSAYIQQTALQTEAKLAERTAPPPATAGVKKIVVDDNATDKHPAKKRAASRPKPENN
ncbi:MAG TPA: hypothetical protein VKZ53_26885 [Candidatus Angelobacter sp.]|nr:hypothetical protein [Candidatus Angelobacter sp.]